MGSRRLFVLLSRVDLVYSGTNGDTPCNMSVEFYIIDLEKVIDGLPLLPTTTKLLPRYTIASFVTPVNLLNVNVTVLRAT